MITDVLQALRFAVRNPGWWIVTVSILGIGIGVNSVMYATVRGLVFAPIEEVFGSDRVVIQSISKGAPGDRGKVSAEELVAIREQAHTIAAVEGCRERDFAWTGMGDAERVPGAEVTEGFFEITHAAIALGRGFLARDSEPSAPRVAVISDLLWRERFQANPGVLGKVVKLDGVAHEIIGVAARRTWFPSVGTKLWTLARLDPHAPSRSARDLLAIAVPNPLAAAGQWNEELAAVSARAAETNPASNTGWTLRATSPFDALISRTDQASAAIMFLITFVVLIIACSNVANLMLAKAISRRRELAVRTAMGASPARLFRLVLGEGLVIAVPAGMVALQLAVWTGNVVIHQFALQSLPPDTLVGGKVMAMTAALALGCVLLVSVAPAMQAIRSNVAATLKAAGPATGTSGVQQRIARALVILQAACAVALLTFTGVAARTVSIFHRIDPGFPREGIATVVTAPPVGRQGGEVRRYHEEMAVRLAAVAGVETVGAFSAVPSVQGDGSPVAIEPEGAVAARQSEQPFGQFFSVLPGSIETLRIPLLRGRGIMAADGEKAPRVAVINEEFAARFWPYDNAVGKRFKMRNQWISIVGVYRNTRMADLRRAPDAQFLLPYAQYPSAALTYVVRAKSPEAILPGLRRAVAEADPDQAAQFTSLDADFYSDLRGTRSFLGLLFLFAALAVVLTSAGLFALMAYTTRQRLHEVGVRMAIGASPAQVMRIVLGEGMQLTVMGLGLGSAAAYGMVKSTEGLLLPVSAADIAIHAAAVMTLLGAAAVACWIPARQAARLSAMAILKTD
ncbi:MAG: ABC transporter permease [Bryobacteraceae bacterium]